MRLLFARKLLLLVCTCLFLCSNSSSNIDHHTVFKIYEFLGVEGYDGIVSYLFNKYRGCQFIPDNVTKDFMISWRTNGIIQVHGQHNQTEMASICHKIAAPLQSTNIPENNPDNILLKYVKMFENIQGSADLLYDLSSIPNCFNPSIAHWKGMLFLACRGPNHPLFGWVDAVKLTLITDEAHYGIGPGLTPMPHIKGEDFRVIAIDDDFLILSFSFFIGSTLQMRAGELVIRDNVVSFQRDFHFVPPSAGDKTLTNHQKNWCPFLYNNDVYFMSQLEPMTTYAFEEYHNVHGNSSSTTNHNIRRSTAAAAAAAGNNRNNHNKNDKDSIRDRNYHNYSTYNISSSNIDYNINDNKRLLSLSSSPVTSKVFVEHQSPPANISWIYGMIKGGTVAHRITNTTYLGFFHSKQYLQPSPLITYVFGAYTFEAQPPFNMLSWSITPIVHRSFYEGAWSHYKNFIDYIVFPMTYTFVNPHFDYRKCNSEKCLENTELLLSIGIQDKHAFLAKINLWQLVSSLNPVGGHSRAVPLFGEHKRS